MIKSKKTNKIIILFLIIICILFILDPKLYANECLNAVSVWATKVFPCLFPFFIITRLIVNLSDFTPNPLDKYFSRLYRTPTGSLSIFLLSAISGYPMGAKLIGTLHDSGRINSSMAEKMLSFTSISGPMFMIGTVGVSILGSYKAGLVIMISNILSGLINGLIYRGKNSYVIETQTPPRNNSSLGDIVYDSLISILMVGSYLTISYLLIEILYNTQILSLLSNTICSVFNLHNKEDIVFGIIVGIIEITRGAIDISASNTSLILKTILASTTIAFGGISILMQSISFLSKIKVPVRKMFLQKSTQMIICLIISIPLAFLLL